MRVLMPLLLLMGLLVPPPYFPACYVTHPQQVDTGVYVSRVNISFHDSPTKTIYSTVPISATNDIVTDTIDLVHPWSIAAPERVALRSSQPYTIYTCRANFRPSVQYLGLLLA